MDLIYTSSAWQDIGILDAYKLDMAFGSDENDFELTLDASDVHLPYRGLIYVEGTEYGGIIDEKKTDSKDGTISYLGRTWHGIIAGRVLCPDAGANYLRVSGEANLVLSDLLDRMGLTGLFDASTADSGMRISYQFERFTDGYTGIRKMLESVGARLCIEYNSGVVELSAVPVSDYSEYDEWDTDHIQMSLDVQSRPVNHLVCLGEGELADRVVIHLFADVDGNVSQAQSLFGVDEVSTIYDYNNASYDDLMTNGIKKLKELQDDDNISIELDPTNDYFIGDIVGGRDSTTGLFVSATIGKKILTHEGAFDTISFEVGDTIGVTLSDNAENNSKQLAEDAAAKAAAKRRVFTSAPTPPYDVGDLYTDGVNIYVCKTSREE